jgi:hypothetical protein
MDLESRTRYTFLTFIAEPQDELGQLAESIAIQRSLDRECRL